LIPLPQGSRFLGYSQGIAAYRIGRQLRLKQTANGKETLFRTLEPRFQAQLGRRESCTPRIEGSGSLRGPS
jgi:hypothetical protein